MKHDIKVKASLIDNYRQYVIQLDRKVNQIYGLPSILRDNQLQFDNNKEYLEQRNNLKALLLALQDYNYICLPDEGLQGINLLPINYNDNNHQKVYMEYGSLLDFLSNIAKRSDHSMEEWFDLINKTWYQVHLLHDIVIESGFDTRSLISSIDKMIDRLSNLESIWENQLTSMGREHLNVTVSKLSKLKEWLVMDMERYGNTEVEDYSTYKRYRDMEEKIWEQNYRDNEFQNVEIRVIWWDVFVSLSAILLFTWMFGWQGIVLWIVLKSLIGLIYQTHDR